MNEQHELSVRLNAIDARFDAVLARAERRLNAFEGSAQKAAQQLTRTNRTVGSSATAFRSMSGQLATVAGQILPVNTGLLRMGGLLASFASGGGVFWVAVGAAAALGAAWRKLTEDARELRESASKAADAVREAWLEEMTQGDIKLIDQIQTLSTELDDLERRRRAAERQRDDTTEFASKRLEAQREEARLQEEIDAKLATRQKAQDMLDARRNKRRAEETAREQRAAEAAAREARRAAEDRAREALQEAKTQQQRIRAMAELATMGLATAEQLSALRTEQERLRSVWRDGTKDVIERRDALEELLRVTRALADAERIRMGFGRLADPTRGQGSAGGPLLRAPRTVTPINPRSDIATTARSPLQQAGADVLSGLQEVGTSIIAQLGPKALAIAAAMEVFRGVLDAIRPALEAIRAPLQALGQLVGVVLNPILKLVAEPLKLLAIAASYVVQALGWLIRAIGEAINFLLPGNPANGLVRFGQSMIDGAKTVRDSLNNMNSAVQQVTASLRNVPLLFNVAFERYRIGSGVGRTATPRALSIGQVIIQASPTGDTPGQLWTKFRAGLQDAASDGDQLARNLAYGTGT